MNTSTADRLNYLIQGRVPRSVAIDLPQLSAEESKRWHKSLNHWSAECGCRAGGIATLIALTAYLVYLLHCGMETNGILARIGNGFAVAFAGAGLGKFAAIRFARFKFRSTARSLLRRVSQVEAG